MLNLPAAIAAYFASERSTDAGTLTACFTADGLVHDEKHDYRGADAIRAWRLDTQVRTPFTSRPVALHERDGRFVVTTEVSGAFPNSPIILEKAFTLADGRIAALDIS